MPEFPHIVEILVTNLCTTIYGAWNSPHKKVGCYVQARAVTRRSLHGTARSYIRPAPLTSVLT